MKFMELVSIVGVVCSIGSIGLLILTICLIRGLCDWVEEETNSCKSDPNCTKKIAGPFEEFQKIEKSEKIFYPFHCVNGEVEVINLKKIICVKGTTVDGKSMTYIEWGYSPKTGEATDNLLVEEDVETVMEIMKQAEIEFILPCVRDESHKIGEND